MMSSSARPVSDLPAVDARLVAPESGYEIVDGRIVEVPPADEPHGERHSKLNALLEAFVGSDYNVACDMLTRTSKTSDIAPDASVYPSARDPHTGGRQLEALAFEVVSTQTLAEAGDKARRLAERGVRRVFALDVAHRRVFEWSGEATTWRVLPDAGSIEDPVLVAPLGVEALVKAAKADDAVAQALLVKRNRVLVDALETERREGRKEGMSAGAKGALFAVIEARGIALTESQRNRIEGCSDSAQLQDWTRLAASADDAADVFDPPTEQG